ncbi:hypothetical protein AWH63_06635 [Marinobacter sp. C18]|uniref:hypothetical protein n=1 Tax=Marinobacter sp. C18 TaxID=1772288 RepID=UPI0009489A94|nr:hypothetical protein [Marinobacter sp. C18]OLF82676.1 hypothetical protein AWH63_06635 [Marinobacter sp. C18]
MSDHVPDEVLMERIKIHLAKGSASIYDLCLEMNRHPKNVRQAVSDLMHYGEVKEHRDGRRYELVDGGFTPGPDGGVAA